MQRNLERKAYGRLKAWKESGRHSTLEISGARQVGKTYLVNRFADEQYRQKIYVNLLELSGELFLEKYHELRQQISDGLICDNPVYELIRRYHPDFNDSKDTIVLMRFRNQRKFITAYGNLQENWKATLLLLEAILAGYWIKTSNIRPETLTLWKSIH